MQLTKRKLLIELKSGNCANTVHRITKTGIKLEQVNYQDEITLRFLASPGDFKSLKKSLKSGETITLIKRIGSMWRVKRAIKHPLIVGALVAYTLVLGAGNVQNTRICILFTSTMVMLYNVYYHVWGAASFEFVCIISAAIGIIRFRKGKAVKETAN